MARRLLTFPNTPPATQYVQGLTEGLPYLERDRERRIQQQNRQQAFGIELAKMDDTKKAETAKAIDELATKMTPDARAALLKQVRDKAPEIFSRTSYSNLPEEQWATAISEKSDYLKMPYQLNPELAGTSAQQAFEAKQQDVITAPQKREVFDYGRGQDVIKQGQVTDRLVLAKENSDQRAASEAADQMNSRSDIAFSEAIWKGLNPRAQEILGGAPFTKPEPPETINDEIKLTDVINRLESHKASMLYWAEQDKKTPDPTRLHRYEADIKRYEAQRELVRSRTPVTGEDMPTAAGNEETSDHEKLWQEWYLDQDQLTKQRIDRVLQKGRTKKEILEAAGY